MDAIEKERAEYWRSVRSLAEEAAALEDEEEREEFLEESVSGSSWVIYYGEALKVIRYTDSDDEAEGAWRDTPHPGEGFWSFLCVAAWRCMRADVAAWVVDEVEA